MVFPSTPMFVPLPEELGIITNVNAIIKLYNKEVVIPCEFKVRYYSSSRDIWPEIFDEAQKPVLLSHKISDSEEPNTSVFEGIYTLYDESYLEGDFYFVFDFCKDDYWYKNYHTNSIHFKQSKDDYYGIIDLLN